MPHGNERVHISRFMISAAMILGAAGAPAAWAQKNSGPLLPDAPAYRVPTAPVYNPPPPVYAPSPPQYAPPYVPQSAPAYAPAFSPPRRAGNPDAERLAQSLPLEPSTRELQDQLPPNPRATEARLGLREPQGPATDMRGRTPTPREIVDALAAR